MENSIHATIILAWYHMDMEVNNLSHIGPEVVIETLLLHSVSPHARRLVEEFSTGDPYLMDIKLDDMSTNRSAEVVETYLKAIGLRLKFIKKRKKKINPIQLHAMMFNQLSKYHPIIPSKDVTGMSKEEIEKYNKHLQEYNADLIKRAEEGKLKDPFEFWDEPQ